MNVPLAAGIVLLFGALGGRAVKLVNLPSVTGYLLAGIVLGPSVFSALPIETTSLLAPINELALGLIAFSIGIELRFKVLRTMVGDAAKIFFVEALLTAGLVFSALSLFGASFHYALIFATLGIATAPGVVVACLRETPTKGDFGKVLLTIVALDNLFAITTFGVAVSIIEAGLTASLSHTSVLQTVALSLGIALLLGVATGVFLVLASLGTKNDSLLLTLALGAILFLVGCASLWDASPLLAAILAGAVYVNFSPLPLRVGRVLLQIEGPVLLFFLTLAGVKLDVASLPTVGIFGVVYILARFFGKLLGSRLGASLTPFPLVWKKNFGRALTPQAGVAIGLAIIAEQKLPFAAGTVITVVLGAVVVFELIGPILLRRALCVTSEDIARTP